MRPYEVVIIFDAGLEEDAVTTVLDRANDTIRNHGGSPGRLERWGRRRFAYEVKHRQEGYYTLLEMTAPTEAVAELDRVLSLADEVVRHKTIRIPDHVAGRSRPRVPTDQAEPAPAAPSERS